MAEDEPTYFVFMPQADVPDGFTFPEWLADMFGVWYTRQRIPVGAMSLDLAGGSAQAVRTDEILDRDDGARAEVWEVRPNG